VQNCGHVICEQASRRGASGQQVSNRDAISRAATSEEHKGGLGKCKTVSM
jgi:hypothetical protein